MVNLQDVFKAFGMQQIKQTTLNRGSALFANNPELRERNRRITDIRERSSELGVPQDQVNSQISLALERERLGSQEVGMGRSGRIARDRLDELPTFDDIERDLIRQETSLFFNVAPQTIEKLGEMGEFEEPNPFNRTESFLGKTSVSPSYATGAASLLFATAVISLNDDVIVDGTAGLADALGLNPDTWGNVIRQNKIGSIDNGTDITSSLLGTDFVDSTIFEALGIQRRGANEHVGGGFGKIGTFSSRIEDEGWVQVALDSAFGLLDVGDVTGVTGLAIGGVSRGLTRGARSASQRVRSGIRGGVAGSEEGFKLTLSGRNIGDETFRRQRDIALNRLARSKDFVDIKDMLIRGDVGSIVEPHRLDIMARQIARLENPERIRRYINNSIAQRAKQLKATQLDRNKLYRRDVKTLIDMGELGPMNRNDVFLNSLTSANYKFKALQEANIPTALRPMVQSVGTVFKSRGELLDYVGRNGVDPLVGFFNNHRLYTNSRSRPRIIAALAKEDEKASITARIVATLLNQPKVFVADVRRAVGLGKALSESGVSINNRVMRDFIFSGNLGMTQRQMKSLSRDIDNVSKLTRDRDELLRLAEEGDAGLRRSFEDTWGGLGASDEERISKLWDMVEEVNALDAAIPDPRDVGRNFYLKDKKLQSLFENRNISDEARVRLTKTFQNSLIGLSNQTYDAMKALGMDVVPDQMNPLLQAKSLRAIIPAELEDSNKFFESLAGDVNGIVDNFNRNSANTTKVKGTKVTKDFRKYLIALRTEDYNRITNNPIGSSMTVGQANQIIRQMENLYGDEIRKTATKLHDFTRETLNIKRDSGMISESDYLNVLDGSEYYVPLKRELDENDRFLSSQFGDRFKQLRSAKGSEAKVVDPISAAEQDRLIAIMGREANEVGTRLQNLIDTGALDDVVQLVSGTDRDAYTFLVNGRQRHYKVLDPHLDTAMKSLFPHEVNTAFRVIGGVTKLLSISYTTANPQFYLKNFNRDLTDLFASITADVGFRSSIKALLRTPQSFAANLPNEYGRYLGASGEDVAKVRIFRSTGGPIGGPINAIARENAEIISPQVKRIFESNVTGNTVTRGARRFTNFVQNAFLGVAGYIENVNRFNAWKAAVEAGATTDQAREVGHFATVNFLERGSGIGGARIPFTNKNIPEQARGLGGAFAFLNAGTQGGNRFRQTALSPQGFATYFGLAFVLAMSEKKINDTSTTPRDTEFLGELNWYDEINRAQPYQAKRYFTFFYNNEDALRLPMSYNAQPFMDLSRIVVRMLDGEIDDAGAIKELSRVPYGAADMLNPFTEGTILHKIMPTALQPFVSNLLNIDWHGGAVAPKKVGELSPFEDTVFDSQVANNSTEWKIAKALSDITNSVGLFNTKLLNTAGKANVVLNTYGGGILDASTALVDTARQLAGEEIIDRNNVKTNPAIYDQVLKGGFTYKRPTQIRIERAEVETIYNEKVKPMVIEAQRAQESGDDDLFLETLNRLTDVKLEFDTYALSDNEIDLGGFMQVLLNNDGATSYGGIFTRSVDNLREPRIEYSVDGQILSVPSLMEWFVYLKLGGYSNSFDDTKRKAKEIYERGVGVMNEVNGNGAPSI